MPPKSKIMIKRKTYNSRRRRMFCNWVWGQSVRTGKAPRNPAGKPGAKLGSSLFHFSTLPARVSLLDFSPHVTDCSPLQYTDSLVVLKHVGRDAERVFRRRKLELEFGLTQTGEMESLVSPEGCCLSWTAAVMHTSTLTYAIGFFFLL